MGTYYKKCYEVKLNLLLTILLSNDTTFNKMKKLEEIFPPKVILPEDIQGIPLEVFVYKKDFGGKSWNQVPESTYSKHLDVFNLMEHSTLSNFIAGFLKILIAYPHDESAWALSFFAQEKRFIDFCTHLSIEQIEKISDVLEACYLAQDYIFKDDEIRQVRENIKIAIKNKND